MNTTIPNNGLPKFTQTTASSGNGSAASNAGTADSAAAASKSGDQVKLTDSALALREAARADASSSIDTKRVDQIRQSIADGSYKIDAGNIADRMIAMDQQLSGAGKA